MRERDETEERREMREERDERRERREIRRKRGERHDGREKRDMTACRRVERIEGNGSVECADHSTETATVAPTTTRLALTTRGGEEARIVRFVTASSPRRYRFVTTSPPRRRHSIDTSIATSSGSARRGGVCRGNGVVTTTEVPAFATDFATAVLCMYVCMYVCMSKFVLSLSRAPRRAGARSARRRRRRARAACARAPPRAAPPLLGILCSLEQLSVHPRWRRGAQGSAPSCVRPPCRRRSSRHALPLSGGARAQWPGSRRSPSFAPRTAVSSQSPTCFASSSRGGPLDCSVTSVQSQSRCTTLLPSVVFLDGYTWVVVAAGRTMHSCEAAVGGRSK